MTVRALRYVRSPSESTTFGERVDALTPDLLAASRTAAPPVAFVIGIDDVPALLEHADLTIDRGRKHPRKGLRVMLGQPRIPVIRGPFRSAGQLLRSVGVLLDHARRRHDRNTYVVGVPAPLVEELAARLVAGPADAGPGDEARPPRGGTEHLLGLLKPADVPKWLERRFIGDSPEARLVRQLILRATRHREPVLILGDTGTGKEVVARAIHDYDEGRRREPFMPVNCGAIAPDLFESELFGHEPGAFTGALRTGKPGLWVQAGNGTIFLDEIGDLPPTHQVKILRVIQEGRVLPVGAVKEVAVFARVVAATNRDLYGMVRIGEFREDLYYRLRPYLIRTPALRHHPSDIPLLATAMWRSISGDDDGRLPRPILAALERYRWPGNARELRAVLLGLHTLFGREGLTREHLDAIFTLQGQLVPSGPDGTPADEARIHRLDSLRHLRLVDEAVRASKVALKGLDRGRIEDSALRQMLGALRRRRDELRVLCGRQLLFPTPASFDAIYRLKGRLAYVAELLKTDVDGARRFWKKTLAPEFRAALSLVAREFERVLSRLEGGPMWPPRDHPESR